MSAFDLSGLRGLLERGADKFLPGDSVSGDSTLMRVGLSREQIRAAMDRARPLSPEEARRAAARAQPKGGRIWGRRGLPGSVIASMYADYQSGMSLAQVGRAYRRSRQSIFELFLTHRLPCRPRRFQRQTTYQGRTYTPGKDGYLRCTSGDRHHLHRRMWEDLYGPIPDGHQVYFRNADNRDCRIANLGCLPIAEVTRYHHPRATARPVAA